MQVLSMHQFSLYMKEDTLLYTSVLMVFSCGHVKSTYNTLKYFVKIKHVQWVLPDIFSHHGELGFL